MISGENKFITCMGKSKYIFQSKIASCSYSQDSYISIWRKCLFDDNANVTNGNKLRT